MVRALGLVIHRDRARIRRQVRRHEGVIEPHVAPEAVAGRPRAHAVAERGPGIDKFARAALGRRRADDLQEPRIRPSRPLSAFKRTFRARMSDLCP